MIAATVGWLEVLVILAVIFLLFGATRLPKLARSLGSARKEFQKGFEKGDEDDG